MSESTPNPSNSALDDLDALVSKLDTKLAGSKRRDAIDLILGSTPRATTVTSLREHETIQRFKKELIDGLIRVDTAHQLLGLIRLAVETVMK